MAIKKISLIENVGKFKKASASKIPLARLTLIHAENGRGKTTLATILRSLASGDPSLINDRRRLGARESPHVVIECQGENLIFKDSEWSGSRPDIAVFNDDFVSANVYSGVTVESTHRRNLHELVLGSEGVELNNALDECIKQVEHHNNGMNEAKGKIPPDALGGMKASEFCELQNDPGIDAKIKDAERRLKAARSVSQIQEKGVFAPLSLPNLDVEKINGTLGSGMRDLESEAEQLVRRHLESIGDRGEAWVNEGLSRVAGASEGKQADHCPFCAQELDGSSIFRHYQSYFNQAYERFKGIDSCPAR